MAPLLWAISLSLTVASLHLLIRKLDRSFDQNRYRYAFILPISLFFGSLLSLVPFFFWNHPSASGLGIGLTLGWVLFLNVRGLIMTTRKAQEERLGNKGPG